MGLADPAWVTPEGGYFRMRIGNAAAPSEFEAANSGPNTTLWNQRGWTWQTVWVRWQPTQLTEVFIGYDAPLNDDTMFLWPMFDMWTVKRPGSTVTSFDDVTLGAVVRSGGGAWVLQMNSEGSLAQVGNDGMPDGSFWVNPGDYLFQLFFLGEDSLPEWVSESHVRDLFGYQLVIYTTSPVLPPPEPSEPIGVRPPPNVDDRFGTVPTPSGPLDPTTGAPPPPGTPGYFAPPDPDAVVPAQPQPGSGTLIDIVRQFSSAVRQPIALSGANIIRMVNMNDEALPAGWSEDDAPSLYHSSTETIRAGAETLRAERGDLIKEVSARLKTNDARILTSGWQPPQRLPVFDGGRAPAKRFTYNLTPRTFTAEVEFQYPSAPTLPPRS